MTSSDALSLIDALIERGAKRIRVGDIEVEFEPRLPAAAEQLTEAGPAISPEEQAYLDEVRRMAEEMP